MADQLSRGLIAKIFEESLVFDRVPVLQVLLVAPRENYNCYRLLVSDGQWSHCSLLEPTLDSMVTSGEIHQGCIIQITKFSFSSNKKHIIFLELTVIKSGAEVDQRVGKPQMYHINKDIVLSDAIVHLAEIKPIIESDDQVTNIPVVSLTRGAIADIFGGGTIEDPILQIRYMQIDPDPSGKNSNCLIVVSDGQQESSNFRLDPEMLMGKTNPTEIAQMFPKNGIFRLNRFVLDDDGSGLIIITIMTLTVLFGVNLEHTGNALPYIHQDNSIQPIRMAQSKIPTHHWLTSFEKRGIYINEAARGSNRPIWWNDN